MTKARYSSKFLQSSAIVRDESYSFQLIIKDKFRDNAINEGHGHRVEAVKVDFYIVRIEMMAHSLVSLLASSAK